jgi:cytochrome oxidase Cu insertion factor (SCO1/SenC/PrrC family)
VRGRLAATLAILGLLALDAALPHLPFARQGREARIRHDEPQAVATVGERLPAFELRDREGRAVRLADFRGKRVLLTFERSVDW